LAQVDNANVQAREDLAAAADRLASFYAALGQTDRALASARTAVTLWTTIGDGSEKTKAGRRRIALARLRCGDINVEVRKFNEAREWYKKAAEGVKTTNEPSDPLLEQVAKRVSEQQEYLDAVESVLANPNNAKDMPERIRVAVLKTAANLELRADHPTNAGALGIQLSRIATAPAD